jgi:hypothetical protein
MIKTLRRIDVPRRLYLGSCPPNQTFGICKHRGSFFERYAMSLKIADRLLGVPGEHAAITVYTLITAPRTDDITTRKYQKQASDMRVRLISNQLRRG